MTATRLRRLLDLYASGLGDRAVARQLRCAPHTVRNHIRRAGLPRHPADARRTTPRVCVDCGKSYEPHRHGGGPRCYPCGRAAQRNGLCPSCHAALRIRPGLRRCNCPEPSGIAP